MTALVVAGLLMMLPSAHAQRRSEAETGLIGIRLFDTGQRLLDVYGEPDDIQQVGGGGAAPAPAGGGGGAAPGSAGPRGGGGGGGGRTRGGGGGGADVQTPFTFGDEVYGSSATNLKQFNPNGGPPNRGGPPPQQGGGQPGVAPTAQPLPPTGGGGAPPSDSSGSSNSYIRWIYKRGGGKYGFVLDKTNKVVQIEAIGMEDNRVRTRKGVSFGVPFTRVIKTYGWPDSYEVAGNSITMRYLLRNKVVFRLNRLGVNKPHVITGILVAAAKS